MSIDAFRHKIRLLFHDCLEEDVDVEVVEVVDTVRGARWLWKGHKIKGVGWVAPADDRRGRMERRQGEAGKRGKKKSGKGEETEKAEKKEWEEGQ